MVTRWITNFIKLGGNSEMSYKRVSLEKNGCPFGCDSGGKKNSRRHWLCHMLNLTPLAFFIDTRTHFFLWLCCGEYQASFTWVCLWRQQHERMIPARVSRTKKLEFGRSLAELRKPERLNFGSPRLYNHPFQTSVWGTRISGTLDLRHHHMSDRMFKNLANVCQRECQINGQIEGQNICL